MHAVSRPCRWHCKLASLLSSIWTTACACQVHGLQLAAWAVCPASGAHRKLWFSVPLLMAADCRSHSVSLDVQACVCSSWPLAVLAAPESMGPAAMQQASLRRQDIDSVHLLAEGGPSQQLKFPFVACEVFCCEVDALIEAVLESDRHLQHLCSLLDAEPPLNCVLAGYFARIFTALLMKRPQVCLAPAWCRFGKSVSTSVLEQSMRNQPGVLTQGSGLPSGASVQAIASPGACPWIYPM